MTSEGLSLIAACFALLSVIALGFSLLTDWIINQVTRGAWLPGRLNSLRLDTQRQRAWEKREFYTRVGGFLGATIAILFQIIAIIIKIQEG
jgi:hypothetical protein